MRIGAFPSPATEIHAESNPWTTPSHTTLHSKHLHTLVTSEREFENSKSSILSTESLDGDVAVFLAYLYDSELESLGGGDTLQPPLRPLAEFPSPGTYS